MSSGVVCVYHILRFVYVVSVRFSGYETQVIRFIVYGLRAVSCYGELTYIWCQVRRYVPFLNGANGEFTNSDDVNPLDKYAMTSDVGSRQERNSGLDAGLKQLSSLSLIPVITPKPNVSSPPSVVSSVSAQVVKVKKPLFFLGAVYENNIYKFISPGSVFEVSTADDLIFASSCVFNKDGSANVGDRPLIGNVYLGVVRVGNIDVAVNRYVDYVPLLVQHMRKQFSLPGSDQRNYNAILRYMYSTYNTLPPKLVVDTFHVFCFELRGFILNREPSSMSASVGLALLTSSSTSFSRVTQLFASLDTEEHRYEFNKRWRIMGSSGFAFDANGSIIQNYPKFVTSGVFELGEPTKFRRVCFARLVGGAPFVVLENCGHNMTSSFSRYFKARDNERQLYENQLSLLALCTSEEQSRCLKLAEASIVDSELVTRPTVKQRCDDGRQRYYPTKYPIKPSTVPVQPVRRYFDLLASKRRSIFDKLRDIVKTVGFQVFEITKFGVVVNKFRAASNYLVRNIYTPFYHLMPFDDWLKWRVMLPHPKKLVYTSWYEDEKTFQKILDNKGTWESLLKDEWAKIRKPGRFYSTSNYLALIDQLVPELLKKAFTTPFNVDKMVDLDTVVCDMPQFDIVYAPANNREESTKMFTDCVSIPNNSFRAVYFSDDGFLVHKSSNGEMSYYETDIKSCDSSNGPAVFVHVHSLLTQFTSRENADKLIELCARTTTVVNPSNKEEWVVIRPETFFEYSGSLLTTVLNNVASIWIFYSVFCGLLSNPLGDKLDLIKSSAALVGWDVTVDQKSSLNQTTFLKRAFDGRTSWRVYGPLFRSLGVIRGDLTHVQFEVTRSEFLSMSEEEKFNVYLRQVVNSESPEPVSCVTNALRVRVGLPELPIELELSSLISRYGCQGWEWVDFCCLLEKLTVGQVITHSVLSAIYYVDYGLPM